MLAQTRVLGVTTELLILHCLSSDQYDQCVVVSLVGCQGYVKPPRSSKSEPYFTATPQTLASGSLKL